MFINDNTKNELRKKFKTDKRSRGKSRRNYLSDKIQSSSSDNVTMSYLLKQQTEKQNDGRQLDNFSVEKHKYSYPIHNHIEQDISVIDIDRDTMINVCCYYVSTTSIRPFLKYLLFKYPEEDTAYSDLLVFPFFKYSEMEEHIDVVDYAKDKISSMFDFVTSSSLKYKGVIKNDDGLNIFIELSESDFSDYNDIAYKSRDNSIWFALISEIVDERKLLNFPINDSVSDLFLHNDHLIYLYDDNGKQYVTPIVVYHGSYYKVTSFISVFGIKKSSVFSSLGPYYYFGNYEKALRYAVWSKSHEPVYIDDEKITDDNGRYTKGGIVRFAIFPGKMKVYSKISTHQEDKSKITQEKMETDEFVKLTARLRDVDAKWIKNYNSVYQGVITLENGELNQRGPHWMIRNHQQQHALTYHYVDTKEIKEKHHKKTDKKKDRASYFGDNEYFIE